MVRDGIYYALAFTSAGVLIAALLGPYYALPLFILATFCAWFFRDPERLLPIGPVALSPADGRVVAVLPDGSRNTRISIFLNIFDVHVNRTPISGTITDITYRKGQFKVASLAIASAENEQNVITVHADDGTERAAFSQIAGLIARRIICYKKSRRHRVQAGERIGLIKFGSRVDVIFGPEWSIEVAPGMRVAGGTSVLARRAGEVVLTKELAATLVEEAALCQDVSVPSQTAATRCSCAVLPTLFTAAANIFLGYLLHPAHHPGRADLCVEPGPGIARFRCRGQDHRFLVHPRWARRPHRPHDQHHERVRA